MAKAESTPVIHIEPMYLDRDGVAAFLSISTSLWESLVARDEAPKPRKLSKGRTAWLVDELRAWGSVRPVSDLLPPEGAGHGRAGKAG